MPLSTVAGHHERDTMKRTETLAERKARGHAGKYEDRQNTLWAEQVKRCKHKWQPVQLAMESEVLRLENGQIRPEIRQPDITDAKLYAVCLKCLSWSYYVVAWAGFYLGSPDLLEEAEASGKDSQR